MESLFFLRKAMSEMQSEKRGQCGSSLSGSPHLVLSCQPAPGHWVVTSGHSHVSPIKNPEANVSNLQMGVRLPPVHPTYQQLVVWGAGAGG